jgi:ribosome biogenesis GTPase / thiamine phosphate phosphatase
MSKLVNYGWADCFAQYFVESDNFEPARVISEHRTGYQIQTENSECFARISGKLRHEASSQAELPAVGDWVVVQTLADDGEAVIQQVLPRKSSFSRKVAGQRTEEQIVAANVDTVWIVSSLDRDFSLRRIERYLTLAWESGASPVIVLTKNDLCDDVHGYSSQVEAIAVGIPVHSTSIITHDGLSELNVYFKDHATVALLGSSGVGKSALINALAGTTLQQTGGLRDDGRGRHTTTYRQLIRLAGGGLIIDTPGMRELQLWDGQGSLGDVFAEIDELAQSCRFSDCRHAGEPGCAVADAIADGRLPDSRLQSYHKLKRELAYLERKQDARAQSEEKQRIKSIMRSVRHHPKYKR